PTGIAVDSANNLVYIADAGNNRIRVVDRASGLINTFAGTGEEGYNGDNITSTRAMLNGPTGIAVDSANNLVYIADAGNNRIRVVDRASGLINTFAGTGDKGYNGEYISAASASMILPCEVTVDNINNLVYIADAGNNRIRVVDRASGLINTFAGTGEEGYNGDNIIATSARLSSPNGVTVDHDNNLLYIADQDNQMIRAVPLVSGVVASNITCFNILSTNTSVCSGNGFCVSYNNCICKKNSYIGQQCENDVTKSSYFLSFNRDTFNESFIYNGYNIPHYNLSDDGIYPQSEICFRSLFDLPGKQFFMALNFPDRPSAKHILQLFLFPEPWNGHVISSAIHFNTTNENMVLMDDGYEVAFSVLQIKAFTSYILYISIDKDLSRITSHITDQKGNILTNTVIYFSDRYFEVSLLRSRYRVCFGLYNDGVVGKHTKLKLLYYGVNSGSVNNGSANNGSANNIPNVRMIIGIVIASLIGYLLM
ncbi:NHL repeat-containing protein, partial [Acrasis kona]